MPIHRELSLYNLITNKMAATGFSIRLMTNAVPQGGPMIVDDIIEPEGTRFRKYEAEDWAELFPDSQTVTNAMIRAVSKTLSWRNTTAIQFSITGIALVIGTVYQSAPEVIGAIVAAPVTWRPNQTISGRFTINNTISRG